MVGEMREPSPVVPGIVVLALGWFICGPTILLSILESAVAVCQIAAEAEGIVALSILILLLLFLLLLLHLFSLFFPTLGISSFGLMQQQQQPPYNHSADVAADGFGFGFGTLLLVFLFIALCHLF